MGAANAGVILIMQWVVGNFVDLDVGPDIGPAPSRQWVDLDQLELVVPFDQSSISSRRGLIAPNSGDPCIVPLQHTSQRLNLS